MPLEKVYDIRVDDVAARLLPALRSRGDVQKLLRSKKIEFTASADRDEVVSLYVIGAQRIFQALDAAEHEYIDLLDGTPGPHARKELSLYRNRRSQFAHETSPTIAPKYVARASTADGDGETPIERAPTPSPAPSSPIEKAGSRAAHPTNAVGDSRRKGGGGGRGAA
jgi:hypothetical protein